MRAVISYRWGYRRDRFIKIWGYLTKLRVLVRRQWVICRSLVLKLYECVRTTWLVHPDILWYCVFNTNFLNIDDVHLWWRYFTANRLNSLWPTDAIWRHRSEWILTPVMVCCLRAPSHHLNQCWLIFSKVQWHSTDVNFTRNTPAPAPAINRWN